MDGVDYVRRPVEPAQAQGRQPMDFRKRAAHDHVLGSGNELDACLVVVAAHVFGVSGIEHEQHMPRQAAMQPLDFVERHVSAGRVVGVGEKNNLGALAHRGEHGVDVGRVVLFRRRDRRRAGAADGDRVDQERVGGVNRLVAVAQIGVGNQVQKVVGARAADDAAGIEPERAPDCLAQRGRVAVGIILQVLTDGVIGGDRLRARSERGFVGRQLEHAGDAGRLALARHVGIDREHAGARLRTLQGGHFTLRDLPAGRERPRAFGGDPIAGCVASDEGRGAHGGAGFDQCVGHSIDAATLRHGYE